MKSKFFLFALFFLMFFGFAKTADAQILFCVCSANCGGGINQCLTAQFRIINSGPCNTQPCTSCINTSWTCGACSPSCGGGTQTCTSNCQETGTFTCNNQPCGESGPVCGDGVCRAGSEFCSTCPSDCGACTTPTPAPTITPAPNDPRTQNCTSAGNYCASSTTNCNSPQDSTVGTCSDNTLCCKAKPPPQKGVYKTTEQCSSSGTWTITDTSCTQTCQASSSTPDCDTGEVCPASECGVVCGNGLGQCYNERLTGGGQCNRKPSGVKPCTRNCPRPQDQTCVANACVDNNTIAGNVFVDVNQNRLKDANEVNYTGAITISSTGGTVTTAAGTYAVNGLTPGSYTISYQNPPTGQGYAMTVPLNGPPPFWSVSVGAGSCSTGGSNNASCDGLGNISNLNFGITNTKPWIQCKGADCRIDSGFTSEVPSTAIGGAYANLNGSGGTPGLIFTGNSTPNFGQGQASTTNWVVGGPTYGELYTPTRVGGIVKTSYNFLLAKASAGNITPTDLSPYCTGGIANCTLQALPHGIYRANGSLTLNTFTFPAGQNYVILVNGALTIRGRITVPAGSTALFSSTGNITVDRTVGETASSTSPTIEGIYSADRSFIAQGVGGCTAGSDLRLNVAGSVITNASLSGGSFQNLRDLCAEDVNYPTIYFAERLDFVLNTPDFLKQPNFTYQEIAP